MNCPNCQHELGEPHHVCGFCGSPTDPVEFKLWILQEGEGQRERDLKAEYQRGYRKGLSEDKTRKTLEDCCRA